MRYQLRYVRTPRAVLQPFNATTMLHGRRSCQHRCVGGGGVVTEGWAVVDGRLLSGVVDVTDDPAALDSTGLWVVAMTFEGSLTCVRFAAFPTARRLVCRVAALVAPPDDDGVGLDAER